MRHRRSKPLYERFAMKKITIAIVFAVLAVIGLTVGVLAAVPAINDRAAEVLADELYSLSPPDGTVVIESVSAAGNLTGNGNKMQYFAAVLVSSDMSIEELYAYYTDAFDGDSIFVNEQTENAIPQSDRGALSFTSTLDEDETYYIIYRWDSTDSFYRNLDIRSH